MGFYDVLVPPVYKPKKEIKNQLIAEDSSLTLASNYCIHNSISLCRAALPGTQVNEEQLGNNKSQ